MSVGSITVVFVDDLNTVRFMQGDKAIDARMVLSALAYNTAKVEHEQELFDCDPASLSKYPCLKSETWRIVPNVSPLIAMTPERIAALIETLGWAEDLAGEYGKEDRPESEFAIVRAMLKEAGR